MQDEPASPRREPPAVNTPPEAVAKRLRAARDAQRQWRRYSLSQRIEALRGWWALLDRRRAELIGVIRGETGRPAAEIETVELDAAELILKYFTRNAHRILQDRAVPVPWPSLNKRAFVRFQPRGVAALIAPCSRPFLYPFADAVPALLAGNAALIKPSEWTPATAVYLAERARETGLFPEGLLQALPGDGSVGAELARGADLVALRGSAATGRALAALAAERLIPAVLHLGGDSAMIVAEDAPLERASSAALWGAFAGAGRDCARVGRVFVHEAAYAEFTRRLSAGAAALRLPQPEGSGTGAADGELGPLVCAEALERFERQLADAREKGARIAGGEPVDRERLLVRPALVFDATREMLLMREEAGGPALAVAKIGRVDEAIRLANEGPFGLGASVWTRDLDRGEEWSALLDAALVSVNELTVHGRICALPYGGFKESGLGVGNSEEGLRVFARQQSVLIHEWPADFPEPAWFPYTRAKSRLLRWLARLS